MITSVFLIILTVKAGKVKKRNLAVLIILILGAGGSCVYNIDQTSNEIANYEQNVEEARVDSCVAQIKSAEDLIDSSEGNLQYILELADIQTNLCLDFDSAEGNYQRVLDLYESKRHTTEQEKYYYLRALESLQTSPVESNKLSVQVREECPHYYDSPNMQRWTDTKTRKYFEERDEIFVVCVQPLVDKFEEIQAIRMEEYQSKIDATLKELSMFR